MSIQQQFRVGPRSRLEIRVWGYHTANKRRDNDVTSMSATSQTLNQTLNQPVLETNEFFKYIQQSTRCHATFCNAHVYIPTTRCRTQHDPHGAIASNSDVITQKFGGSQNHAQKSQKTDSNQISCHLANRTIWTHQSFRLPTPTSATPLNKTLNLDAWNCLRT